MISQCLKKWTFLFLLMAGLMGVAKPAQAQELKYLPVQDAGRVKPFDTFAREMLSIVYGKSTFEGREAYEIVFTWMLSPESWQKKALFEVRNFELLKNLNLPADKKLFTGEELFNNDRFTLLRQELQAKRDSKEKLNPYFQALQRLENQFFIFQEMASGRLLRLIPTDQAWVSVYDFNSDQQVLFLALTKAFVNYLGVVSGTVGGSEGGRAGEVKEALKFLDQAVNQFEDYARTQNPAHYPDLSKIKTEVHYNDFHPFRWAYICYLLTSLLLLWIWISDKTSVMKWAWVVLALGFVLHTYGFLIRVYLMGRAPVTNMYETVVWVAWGSVVFAAILEKIYKFKFILLAGSLVGLFSLVIADMAPVVLDPSLQPLEPVLRSNYWLTIHVMTITISYAAFFLALCLADLGLVYFLRGEEQNKEKIKAVALSVYRCMQIGVMFLTPGIILGGIWADYSWGRFWGWDPKETWALIALLGYVAALHAKMVGWLKDFGMLVSAIGTFSLVIMAWYGVNFVLGAGLHSYGFGAGGIEYVLAFVLAHAAWVATVAFLRKD
ncbi:MAG: cytochrome c biogenesis protein [Pseudobdellovibrionaceae bacterium]